MSATGVWSNAGAILVRDPWFESEGVVMAMEEKEPSFETTTTRRETREATLASEKGELKVTPLEANPGDTLRWKAGNRTVSIWFPTQGVFSAPAIANRGTGDIEITVPLTAKSGTYKYAIYCHESYQFATCTSHPKLVIPVPN